MESSATTDIGKQDINEIVTENLSESGGVSKNEDDPAVATND
jgi:hypothetical protein